MRLHSTLSTAAAVVLTLSLVPFASAQSNAEWIAYKQKCGIPANTAYNDWVAAGSKCNTASSASAPTLTPQQQAATAIGQVGANMLGQGLRQLFAGPALDPATQQRALAAQQLHNSGVYLLRQHNYPGAINEFQKALTLTPNDPAIKRDLQQALDLQKQSAVAGKTSETLGELLSGTTTPAVVTPAPKPYTPVNLDPNVVDFRGIGHGASDTASSNLPAANANRLNTVITGSDSSTVDLRGANKNSVNSLKSQIDSLFGTPVAPPPTSAPSPQEIDQIFPANTHPDHPQR